MAQKALGGPPRRMSLGGATRSRGNQAPVGSLGSPSAQTSENRSPAGILRFAVLLVATACLLVHRAAAQSAGVADSPAPATSESETPVRLLDQAPYDVLLLNDADKTTEKLLPLNLPQRKLPVAPKPTDVLRLRMVRQPDMEYEVYWKDIAEVRLFEDLLLAEARRLAAAKRFDEAFDYFVHLRREAPQLKGLNEAEQEWLVEAAKYDLSRRRWENALVECRQLQELNAVHPQLSELYGQAVENLVRERLQRGEPVAARAAVLDLSAKFPGHSAVSRLNEEITRGLNDVIERADAGMKDRRYAEAQDGLAAALALVPDSSRALALFEKSVAEYPCVKVGVTELSPSWSPPAVGDWAARRTRELLNRPTLALRITSGDAPTVRYAPGTAAWSIDERDETLTRWKWNTPRSERPSAYVASMSLFRSAWPASPTFRPDAEATKMTLRPIDADLLEVRFGRPHPRAEALVAAVLDGAAEFRISGSYTAASSGPDEVRFVRRPEVASGLNEIVERKFSDENEAVAALGRGEVDVVDRIAPWHAATLQTLKDAAIVRYAAPTVHGLWLKTVGGPLENMELRRAVAFAVDRESILRNYLQPPADDATVRLASGVFPAGRSNDDPLGYAHALTQAQRPYDPRRAFILARLAAFAGSAVAAPSASPTLPTLTLSYPPTAVGARACERIQDALGRIGISVELRRRAGDAPVDDADLIYFTASSLEPLVDAPAWFGPNGALRLPGPAAAAALRRLSEAETFVAARAALHELQRVIHDEVLLVPLWQLNEYAAYRRRVTLGPSDHAPTSLYQFVDRWQVSARISLPVP